MRSSLNRAEGAERGPGASPSGVVLVGNPNVGKSALFGALTGTYVTVSNYPGTTVEVTTGTRPCGAAGGDRRHPGRRLLLPFSEDERVTRDILLAGHARARRSWSATRRTSSATLLLALQLAEMELPFVLCLNMMDEAARARARTSTRSVWPQSLGVDGRPDRGRAPRGHRRAAGGPGHGPAPAAVRVAYPGRDREGARVGRSRSCPTRAWSARALALMVLVGRRDAGRLARPAARADVAARASRPSATRLRRAVCRDRSRTSSTARACAGGAALAATVGPRRGRRRSGRDAARAGPRARHDAPVWGLPILALVLYARLPVRRRLRREDAGGSAGERPLRTASSTRRPSRPPTAASPGRSSATSSWARTASSRWR